MKLSLTSHSSTLVILLVFVLLADCFTREEDTSGPKPEIKFSETRYDAGIVESGQEISHVFTFINVGNAALEIQGIVENCSCTAALLSNSKIPPGAEGEIKVQFRASSPRETARVRVTSNDPRQRQVYLTVFARIKSHISMSCETLAFGDVPSTEGKSAKMYIYHFSSDGQKRLEVEGLNSTSNFVVPKLIRKKVTEKDTGQIVEEVTVQVSIKPGLPVGLVSEKVVIYTTEPCHRRLELNVSARIIGDFTVFPERLFFGITRIGDRKTRKVTISALRQKSLKILRIEHDIEPLEIDLVQRTANSYDIVACLKEDARPGRVSDEINVYTNSVQQPVLEIPVYALLLGE